MSDMFTTYHSFIVIPSFRSVRGMSELLHDKCVVNYILWSYFLVSMIIE
jgi:hypothetical protein